MTILPMDVWCTPMSLERDNPQDVAWLIYESAPELFALIFGRKAVPILTALVKRSRNRFSHRYIRVAQASSRVLGIAIVVGAADVNDNADYHTVLSFWGQLRLQLVQSLILNRVLKHDYPPGTFYIANLAVHPDYRAKGIGTQLLLRCIADAKAAEASAVFISVSIDNPRAQKLYESLGFQVVAAKTMHLFRSALGTRVLALSLRDDCLINS